MLSIGIPLLLALIWGVLMVFVWRSISKERQVTKSIVAIVGGLTCLMIFKLGRMLSLLVDAQMGRELDLIYSRPAEPQAESESSAGAQKPVIREVVIRVTESGSLNLDGRPLDDVSLEAELMNLAGAEPKPVVTICADEFAPYQRVTDVLNLLAKTRINNVTFEVPEQK